MLTCFIRSAIPSALAWHQQGDPAWTESAQAKDGQGLSLTFTLWDQDCVVTVDELSKLPLPKMSKLYTVSTNWNVKGPGFWALVDKVASMIGNGGHC